MILANSYHGSFTGNPFIIGTTDKNEYYPAYAASDDLLSSGYTRRRSSERLSELVLNDILLYKKPVNAAINKYGGITKYADLFYCLQYSISSDVFEFTVNDVKYYLTCSKGYIADADDNILLLLCTNNEDLFDNRGNLQSKNLKLFVSNKLINNSIYKNIFKKIDSEYIHFCYENDIDVVFTTSEKIQNSVFSNNFKVDYNNLTELNDHLNGGVGSNLFFSEEIYLNEDVQEVLEDLPF